MSAEEVELKRFPPVEGLDYKRGAREYASHLSPGEVDHLFTKPFYNLEIKVARDGVGGIDPDTHRHFCDFANLVRLLELPPQARILEIACGSGWLCEYLARFGYDVTGVDISAELIAVANERIADFPYGVDRRTPLKCSFEEHDIESSALAQTFDLIICYDSLHHFLDERAVLRHASEMLAPDGRLFIMEGESPAPDSKDGENLRAVMNRYATLESPFARRYLIEILEESGFAVEGDYISVSGFFPRRQTDWTPIRAAAEPVNYLLCRIITR